MATNKAGSYVISGQLEADRIFLSPVEASSQVVPTGLLYVTAEGEIVYSADGSSFSSSSVPTLSDVSQVITTTSVISDNLSSTSASVATILASEGSPGGIATLDSSGNVPADQLGNISNVPAFEQLSAQVSSISADTGAITTYGYNFAPWTEPTWKAILANQVSNGTVVPVYQGPIANGSNQTYFINSTNASDQPIVVTIQFQNTTTVSLLISGGNPISSPVLSGYIIPPGVQSITLPLPSFVVRPIAAGTYADVSTGQSSITFTQTTPCLCFYIGVGFPGGPLIYPPSSPFAFGFVLSTAVGTYLSSSTPVVITAYS